MEASRRGLITRWKNHRSLLNALYQNNLAPIVCRLFLAFVLFCFLFASLLIVTLIVISLISKWIKIPGLTPEITLCWFWDRPPLYVLRFETSLSLFGLPRSRTVVPSQWHVQPNIKNSNILNTIYINIFFYISRVSISFRLEGVKPDFIIRTPLPTYHPHMLLQQKHHTNYNNNELY